MLKLRAPYINDYQVPLRVKYRVNLPLQMAECELNYAYLKKLIRGDSQDQYQFSLSNNEHQWFYQLDVIERSPYTITLRLTQTNRSSANSNWLHMPSLTVRMYHDAKLAEVLAWEGHKRLRPRYDYPNQAMYQSDEKLQINQFLGEWLRTCLQYGELRGYVFNLPK